MFAAAVLVAARTRSRDLPETLAVGSRPKNGGTALRRQVISCAALIPLLLFVAAGVQAHSPGRGHQPVDAATRPQIQQLAPAYTVHRLTVLDPGQVVEARRLNSSEEVAGGSRGPHEGGGAFVLGRNGREPVTIQRFTDYSTSYGINDIGEVVGAFNKDVAVRPFRWTRRGGHQELATLPGDTAGVALGINQRGEATGYSSGASGVRAVWWTRSGAVQALPQVTGAKTTQSQAINDRGDIVGKSGTAGFERAILWRNKGSAVSLGTLPGDAESEATAINDAGDIVGSSGDLNGVNGARAVLWPLGGAIQSLGILAGGDDSRARDINERGEVVGISTSSLGTRAFIWTAGKGMQDLNALVTGTSLILTEAASINKNGVIVAFGQEAGDGSIDGHEEVPISVVLLRPIR